MFENVVYRFLESQTVYAVQARVAGMGPEFVGPVIGPLIERLESALTAAGRPILAPATFWYESTGDGGMVVHVGQAAEDIPVAGIGYDVVDLPEVWAAVVFHRGDMSTLAQTWSRIHARLDEDGYRISAPSREQYLRAPGHQPGPDWLTEIQVPVERIVPISRDEVEIFGGEAINLREVRFSVTSRLVSAEEISAALGMAPDKSWSLGDPSPGNAHLRPDRQRVRRESLWQINSSLPRPAHFEDHLDDLRGRVEAVTSRVADVADDARGLLSVLHHQDGRAEQGHGFVLDGRWIRLLATARATLSLDQYVIRDGPLDDDEV
jgi:effector-binding domain-containing protein